MTLKFISWNVNVIRAVLKKGFLEFLSQENADFVCLQEVKATSDQLEERFEGYRQYWNSAEKKGYSGTLVLSRHTPLSVQNGIGILKHDKEGRVITLEFPNWYLVNVYTPNAKRELERLPYRSEEWDRDFLKYCKNIEKKKPVIFCGDLNVAHKEIDLARPKQNTKNAGFTPEERAGFDNIVKAGFIDTFREFESGGDKYTWLSYRAGAREKNVGWRIDYFCISKELQSKLISAGIKQDVMGSDHCPVYIELKDSI